MTKILDFLKFVIDDAISPEGIVFAAMILGSMTLSPAATEKILIAAMGAGSGAAYSQVKRKGRKKLNEYIPNVLKPKAAKEDTAASYEEGM